MYNIINTINMAVGYIYKLRLHAGSFHYKKEKFFSVCLILYPYEMMDAY